MKKHYGPETGAALLNFPLSTYRLPPVFIESYALVKRVCAHANMELGHLDKKKGRAISTICLEIEAGNHHDQIVVDPLQGGAGTSTNMNMNEVIASLATEKLATRTPELTVMPLADLNMHQSTNDTYPTAVRIAMLRLMKQLEVSISNLQEALQQKEHQFQHIVKLGRTQLQDAVPTTLGITFGAFADAISRDRWRIFKARERIKIVNLGGTAIGTGLGAPRNYIFKVTELLKQLSGLVIARGENLVDTTQNLDTFVEVSGMLKAYATSLMKIANDLRLMGSGPYGGLGEITLPAVQAGSTIMPGKVNPVIPESVIQVALKTIANDQTIALVAAMGQLELNHLFPLLTHSMLESLMLLNNATKVFTTRCIEGIKANEEQCKRLLLRSESIITVLVPMLGYQKIAQLLNTAQKNNTPIKTVLLESKLITEEQLNRLLSPGNMYQLGYNPKDYQ